MTEGIPLNVGESLQRLRAERGLSMRALAKASGLSANALSMIERGRTSPSVGTLYKLADALGVPVTAFFGTPEVRQQVIHLGAHERGARSGGGRHLGGTGRGKIHRPGGTLRPEPRARRRQRSRAAGAYRSRVRLCPGRKYRVPGGRSPVPALPGGQPFVRRPPRPQMAQPRSSAGERIDRPFGLFRERPPAVHACAQANAPGCAEMIVPPA